MLSSRPSPTTVAARGLAVLLLALVVACGGGSGATGATGHLHIVATLGPTCPVERPGGPPCVAPYTGPLDVLGPDGSTLTVSTSAAGTADLDLAAGVYRISMTTPMGGVGGMRQPVSVVVVAGATVTASVDIDTGIR